MAGSQETCIGLLFGGKIHIKSDLEEVEDMEALKVHYVTFLQAYK